jgi:hypothetical protein
VKIVFKSGYDERRHDILWYWQGFLADEKGVLLLFHSFGLRQSRSPLFGFFGLAPGFVDFD